MSKDNVDLGRFNLVGIPPAPRGIPQIEVTFDIDANGILNVTAKDRGTGREQKIVITASTKLSKDQIDEAMKKAQDFSDKDTKAKEVAELKNTADSLVYQAEKLIADSGDKFGSEMTSKIREGMDEVRKVLEKDDAVEITAAMESLKKKLYEASTELYKRAGAQSSEQPPPGEQSSGSSEEPSPGSGAQGDEKVVDADYEVVDEGKDKDKDKDKDE